MSKVAILLFINLSIFLGCNSKRVVRNTETTIPAKKAEISISPKLYLEQSGSMFGYDNPKIVSNLKNALIGMMTEFKQAGSKSDLIYIVNDSVYKYDKQLDFIIKSPSIFATKIGNPAYTDFSSIFKNINSNLKKGEVAILFSDLIYSSKTDGGKSSAKLGTEIQQIITNEFISNSSKNTILILQFYSEFNGLYYPFNSPNKGKTFLGKRPFYISLIAQNNTFKELLSNPKFSKIIDFPNYSGFQNSILFSNDSFYTNPIYSTIERDPEGSITFTCRDSGEKHNLINVKDRSRTNSKPTLCITVALPKSIFNPIEIKDSSNYLVSPNKDGFIIKAIKAMDVSNYKFILEAQNFSRGDRDFSISLKNPNPPEWISKTNSVDDTNFNTQFSNQTFLFKSLFDGFHESYSIKDKRFELKFTLKE